MRRWNKYISAVCGGYTEPVIDAGSAAAALHKALSALGPNSTYSSSSDTGYGGGYVDPGQLRAASSTAAPGSSGEMDSFYGAYIIRPTVVERSTVDRRQPAGQGGQSISVCTFIHSLSTPTPAVADAWVR